MKYYYMNKTKYCELFTFHHGLKKSSHCIIDPKDFADCKEERQKIEKSKAYALLHMHSDNTIIRLFAHLKIKDYELQKFSTMPKLYPDYQFNYLNKNTPIRYTDEK